MLSGVAPITDPVVAPRTMGGLKARFAYLGVTAIVLPLLLLLFLIIDWRDLSLAALSNIASLSALAVMAAVLPLCPRGIWSASFSYLAVFCLFHFGLTFVFGLSLPITSDAAPYLYDWFSGPSAKEAVILACTGLVACGLGIRIALSLGKRGMRARTEFTDSVNCFDFVGFLFVFLSVCGWFVIVFRSGGAGLLFSSYTHYMEATEGEPIPLIDYGVGLGMAFLAAATASRLRRLGFTTFIIWAVFAFPIGLRGEVLFPSVTALVISARRTKPLPISWTVLLTIGVLCAVALVKDLRQVGVENLGSSPASASPLSALTEMGGSLRPVVEVVTWIDTGDRFSNGSSYWAPFDRALYHLIPGWVRPEAEEDDRLMNVLVAKRVGEIGFSPIAEAYYNWGAYGVAFVMFLTGLLLGRLDLWHHTPTRHVALGVIVLELLMQVRNDFTPVPAHIAAGLFVLFIASVIRPSSGWGRRRRDRWGATHGSCSDH